MIALFKGYQTTSVIESGTFNGMPCYNNCYDYYVKASKGDTFVYAVIANSAPVSVLEVTTDVDSNNNVVPSLSNVYLVGTTDVGFRIPIYSCYIKDRNNYRCPPNCKLRGAKGVQGLFVNDTNPNYYGLNCPKERDGAGSIYHANLTKTNTLIFGIKKSGGSFTSIKYVKI